MYHFHKKLKIKKTPQKTFLVGLFRWVFWVFLGGFYIANPAPAGHRSGRWGAAGGGVRWGPLLRRDGGGAGGGGCGVGPCAGARCRWERADSRLFSTGRRSDWASRPAPVIRKIYIC